MHYRASVKTASYLAVLVAVCGALACAKPPVGIHQAALIISAPLTCDTHELSLTGDSVTLTPGSYVSWVAMFTANPNRLDYLVSPGDYRSWGPLLVTNRSGALARKRTIRYLGASDHPVRRSEQALVDGIKFSNSSNWIVAGLTTLTPSVNNSIGSNSQHVTWEALLIDNADDYGIRVFSTTDVCIQHSVLRNPPTGGDGVGIQLKPVTTPVVGARLLSNEISDYVDAIAMTDHGTDSWVNADATIADNDLYTSPSRAFCTENGIDIKTGNDAVTTKITGNRIWGYVGTNTACAGSGSRGDAIVLHIAARNIEISGNIIGEGANGINVGYWPATWAGQQQMPRHITVSDNYFYSLNSAYDFMMDVAVTGNTVAQSTYLCDTGGDSGVRAGGPVFTGNARIAVGAVSPPGDAHACPYNEANNTTIEPSGPFVYQRRLLTGEAFVLPLGM